MNANALTERLPLGKQMAHARRRGRKDGTVPGCTTTICPEDKQRTTDREGRTPQYRK